MPINESNTRVSLREFIEAKFKALDRLLEVKFDAIDTKFDAIDAKVNAKIEASANLETERWKAHNAVHVRERGISAILMTALSAILAFFGVRLPR